MVLEGDGDDSLGKAAGTFPGEGERSNCGLAKRSSAPSETSGRMTNHPYTTCGTYQYQVETSTR